MAIKTLVFQSDSEDNQLAKVASEVAIASNLVHHNIVATYSHDVCPVQDNSNNELGIYKFYLIQVSFYLKREIICVKSSYDADARQPYAHPCSNMF